MSFVILAGLLVSACIKHHLVSEYAQILSSTKISTTRIDLTPWQDLM